LIRNLYQRNETLERIVKAIAKRQRSFFMHSGGLLTPMTMMMLAEELELHESTIARAVSNKYVNSPRGLFPLRYFFTNAYVTHEGVDISSQTVRQALQDLIDHENKQKPLSDAKLSNLLKDQGITCARRTIAKYRTELNVGNAQQRRRF
jgi:RNA polymerase sigma-54 factor